mgnify:CR=1 FL=1
MREERQITSRVNSALQRAKSAAGFVNKGFNILLNSVLSIGVFLIACFVSLEALLRYVVHSMPVGIEEGTLIIAVWVYFLGIAAASRDGKQITVSILDTLPISVNIRRRLDLVPDVVLLGTSCLFAYFAIVYCVKTYTSHVQVPPFYCSALVSTLSLAVGFVLASLYSAAQLVKKVRRGINLHVKPSRDDSFDDRCH